MNRRSINTNGRRAAALTLTLAVMSCAFLMVSHRMLRSDAGTATSTTTMTAIAPSEAGPSITVTPPASTGTTAGDDGTNTSILSGTSNPAGASGSGMSLVTPTGSADRIREYMQSGKSIARAFRPFAMSTRDSVVRIRGRWSTVALGTIVGDDGWIVAKASILPENPRCVISSGRTLSAEVRAVDTEYDVALLKVEAEGLVPARFDARKEFAVGQWMVSVGSSNDPIGVGVASVLPRKIPQRRGFLGVTLEESNLGVRVDSVEKDSAADAARIRVNDRLTAVNGKAISSLSECTAAIGSNRPGTSIQLTIERDERAILVHARLGQRLDHEAEDYGEGDIDIRRTGFPLAVQHDTPLEPEQIGGPVIDAHGRVVAINIARAGRTQTYAIPAAQILEIVRRLQGEATRV